METTTASPRAALRSERPACVARAAVARPAHPDAADADCWCALLGSTALASAELDTLSSIALTRQVGPGEAVFTRAESATALVALVEGVVTLGWRAANGTLRTERIVHGPAWLDLSSAWLDGHHAIDARAGSAALIVELPAEPLQAALARLPNLATCFIRGLAREVHALAVNTHELMHKDAPGRLAQWLLLRSEVAPGPDGQRIVHLSERKRDIASQLAITPETLSRLMRSFSHQGVVEVAGYTVRVLDPQALARLAQA